MGRIHLEKLRKLREEQVTLHQLLLWLLLHMRLKLFSRVKLIDVGGHVTSLTEATRALILIKGYTLFQLLKEENTPLFI